MVNNNSPWCTIVHKHKTYKLLATADKNLELLEDPKTNLRNAVERNKRFT